MVYPDLTTFTETDPNSHLTVTSTTITAVGLTSAELASVAKSYGAGFFAGNIIAQCEFSMSTATSPDKFEVLSFSNGAPDAATTNTYAKAYIYGLYSSSSVTNLFVRENVPGVGFGTSATSISITRDGTSHYIELSRDTTVGTYGTLYLKEYTDNTFTTQTGSTVSYAISASYAYNFEYFIPAQSYGSSTGTSSLIVTNPSYLVPVAITTISATKGASTWAGKTATIIAAVLTATIGASTWSGNTSNFSIQIPASKGTSTWAGIPANVATGNSFQATKGASTWVGKTATLQHQLNATVGASTWTGRTSILGATVTSIRSWRITKWDTVTSKHIPVTGLTTVKYFLYDPATGFTMDFSDATFKAYTSCVTPKGTMVERDSTNYPGVYDFLMGTTGLSGLYQEFAESYGADNYFSENPVRFQDGTEYLGGLTVSENTQIFALPTAAANAAALLAAATTTPIAANMEQTHGTQLKGDGTAADKFRSTLVP